MKPEGSDQGQNLNPRLKVRVRPAAERSIRKGHPWVYADSIRETNRHGETGDLAVVYDRNNRFLAIGHFDPESPIRIRILHHGKPIQLDEVWWRQRLSDTIAKRRPILSGKTNGCRLIHGENDGWPGLVLDQYAGVQVLKLYTLSWIPILDEIRHWILDECPPDSIVLRMSRNIQEAASKRFGRKDGQLLYGPVPTGPVPFVENGVWFEADVLKGQKTGFFLDQRDNRLRISSLALGKQVLNAFSFSGGFSLLAAAGGASSVTDLDISRHALESAQRNWLLNKGNMRISQCRHKTVQADVFKWFKGDPDQTFDVVIVDPPSLAKKERERQGALQAYHQLALGAIQRVSRGGILLACSCSAHVGADEFFEVVRSAARESGRSWRELETSGHPEDHPQLDCFPEAAYLKGIYLSFED